MNMDTMDNIIWDVYFPQLLAQYETRSFLDDDESWAQKQEIAKFLRKATREEIKAWQQRVAKAERRARYEALKEEFEEDDGSQDG